MRISSSIALLGLLASLAGCGGEGDDASEGDQATPEIAGDADSAAVEVIDGWSSTLRQGDLERAAGFFALPSVAENGPTLIPIEDRGDARAFNASLPCGARLIRAEAEGEFTVATFRLTERPGPGACGAGTGATAQTAFVIEDRKIVEWRRVAAGGESAPSRPT